MQLVRVPAVFSTIVHSENCENDNCVLFIGQINGYVRKGNTVIIKRKNISNCAGHMLTQLDSKTKIGEKSEREKGWVKSRMGVLRDLKMCAENL